MKSYEAQKLSKEFKDDLESVLSQILKKHSDDVKNGDMTQEQFAKEVKAAFISTTNIYLKKYGIQLPEQDDKTVSSTSTTNLGEDVLVKLNEFTNSIYNLNGVLERSSSELFSAIKIAPVVAERIGVYNKAFALEIAKLVGNFLGVVATFITTCIGAGAAIAAASTANPALFALGAVTAGSSLGLFLKCAENLLNSNILDAGDKAIRGDQFIRENDVDTKITNFSHRMSYKLEALAKALESQGVGVTGGHSV